MSNVATTDGACLAAALRQPGRGPLEFVYAIGGMTERAGEPESSTQGLRLFRVRGVIETHLRQAGYDLDLQMYRRVVDTLVPVVARLLEDEHPKAS
mgnify:CR=1 FL=1